MSNASYCKWPILTTTGYLQTSHTCKQTGIHWLVFSEQTRGMFCILCNKHGAQNERNKSKT